MHSFEQRARAIMETAQMGVSDNVTLICTPQGGLHMVMGENSFLPATRESSQEASAATYQVLRRGASVLVTGRQGNRTCSIEAPAAPYVLPLLLDNQALYQVAALGCLQQASQL